MQNVNIIINEIGRSYINRTDFYYALYTEEHLDELFNINSHYNAIDIYMTPESNPTNLAYVNGSAFTVAGNSKNTSIISHEFGHCLGLLHTHSGSGCADYYSCSENADGSNCTTCGDRICDTPADPCLAGLVNNNQHSQQYSLTLPLTPANLRH